jgi:hypothetical protein
MLRILQEHASHVACGEEPSDQPATTTREGDASGAAALAGQGF